MATLLGTLAVKLKADTQQFVSAMNSVSKQIEKHQQGFKMLAAGAGILSGGLVAFGMKAARAGNEFDKSMTRVGAITNSTGSKLDELSNQALKWSEQTIFSAQQVAEGMNFMAMAGNDTQKILKGMPSVLKLATVGMMDLGTASDIVTNIMAGFGKKTTAELDIAVNQIANAITTANVDVIQLGESFKMVASTAKGAGIAFDETIATISLLGNAGIQGTMAGTAVRTAMKNMLKPTSAAKDLMKELGLTFTKSNGQLKPLVEIFGDLQRANVGLTDSLTLFDVRAANAMNTLIELGPSTLKDFTAGVNTAGTATRINEQIMGSFSGQVEQLKSKFGVFQIKIQESLVPVLETLNDILSDVLDAFNDLPKPMRDFIVTGGVVTAVVSGMAAAFIALNLAMPGIKDGFKGIRNIAQMAIKALAPFATIIGAFLVKGFIALKAAIIPLLPAIAAVAAAIGAFYLLFDGYFELLKFYGVDVKNLGKDITASFKSMLQSLGGMLSGFKLTFELFWIKLTVAWEKTITKFTTWFEISFPKILDVAKNVIETMKGMFHTALDPFIVAFDFYFGKGAGLRTPAKPEEVLPMPELEGIPKDKKTTPTRRPVEERDLFSPGNLTSVNEELATFKGFLEGIDEEIAQSLVTNLENAGIYQKENQEAIDASTKQFADLLDQTKGLDEAQKELTDHIEKFANKLAPIAKQTPVLSVQGKSTKDLKFDKEIEALNTELKDTAEALAFTTATGMERAGKEFAVTFSDQTGKAAEVVAEAVKQRANSKLIKIAEFTMSTIGSAFGEFGQVIQGAIEGFKSGGVIGAIIGAIAAILAQSEAFKKSMVVFNNLMKVLVKTFEPIAETLVAFIQVGIPVILLVTQLLGAFFRILKPFVTIIQMLTTMLFKAVNTIGRWYNKLINFLIGIAETLQLDKLAKKLRKAKFKTISPTALLDEEAEVAADSLENLADTARETAEALLNVPEGFKTALRRFESIFAIGEGTGLSQGAAAPGAGSQNLNVQIDSVDPKQTWEIIKRFAEGDRYVANGSVIGSIASPFSTPANGA